MPRTVAKPNDPANTDVQRESPAGSPPAVDGRTDFDGFCASARADDQRLVRRLWNRVRLGGRRRDALRRLRGEICVLASELERVALDPHDSTAIRALLHEAVAALRAGELNVGYDALHAAQRVSLANQDSADERAALAARIEAEASANLSDWRLLAVAALLQPRENGGPPPIADLLQSQRLLDEQTSNTYRQLDVYGRTLGFVLAALVVLLVAMYFVVDGSWLEFLSETTLATSEGYLGVVVLGALGAMLSVALTRLRASGHRLPEMFESRLVDGLRPAIGAASAVALVLVVESGIVTVISADGAQIYVWALVAGFSERLLRRTLHSLAQSVASPQSAGDGQPEPGD